MFQDEENFCGGYLEYESATNDEMYNFTLKTSHFNHKSHGVVSKLLSHFILIK